MLPDRQSQSATNTNVTTRAKIIAFVLVVTVVVALVTTGQQGSTEKAKPSQLYSRQTRQDDPPRPASTLINAHDDILNGVKMLGVIYPGLIGVKYWGPRGTPFMCTGWAINSFWVVTAGHCCKGITPSTVSSKVHLYNGITSGGRYNFADAVDVKIFPSYKAGRRSGSTWTAEVNDVCILKSAQTLGQTRFELANGPPTNITRPLRIAGFGVTNGAQTMNSGPVRHAYTGLVTIKSCLGTNSVKAAMKGCTNWTPTFASSLLCVKGGHTGFPKNNANLIGVCKGDSGGPIFDDYVGANGMRKVYGVASFKTGITSACTAGPSFYTAVSKPPFYDWVRTRTRVP